VAAESPSDADEYRIRAERYDWMLLMRDGEIDGGELTNHACAISQKGSAVARRVKSVFMFRQRWSMRDVMSWGETREN